MKFPLVNISIKEWNPKKDYLLYILEDPYIYRASNKLYHEYFYNHHFVDSKGDVYQIIDRKVPNLLKQLFSFIPDSCEIEFIFVKTGEKMELESVREHVLKQLSKLDDCSNKIEWMKLVKEAQTYEIVIVS